MIEELPGISAEASILHLDHGVYALGIAKLGEAVSQHFSMLLPAVHVSQPPAHHLRGAESLLLMVARIAGSVPRAGLLSSKRRLAAAAC